MNEATKKYPRITPEDIDYAIESARQVHCHRVPDTTTTIVAVTLGNGFTVIGKSAAVSPENFDEEVGVQVAMDDVRDQLWELLGFRLKQALWEGADKAAREAQPRRGE